MKIPKSVIDELVKRVDEEQALRLKWPKDAPGEAFLNKVRKIDAENTKFLKELISKYGWPTISQVGKDAARAAWLTVQHTPDKEFRKECLELMKLAGPSEVENQNLARTIDRVRILDGLPQYYGTSFTLTPEGAWAAKNIEDLNNVDTRRAAMGLTTLEEDTKRINND